MERLRGAPLKRKKGDPRYRRSRRLSPEGHGARASIAEWPGHRRVVHVAIARDELPGGLRWQLRHR